MCAGFVLSFYNQRSFGTFGMGGSSARTLEVRFVSDVLELKQTDRNWSVCRIWADRTTSPFNSNLTNSIQTQTVDDDDDDDDDDDELMLKVLRCQLTYYGQVVANAEARFNKSLRPRKPEGSLGRTDQDVHLDSHTAPELWTQTVQKNAYLLWHGHTICKFVCVCVRVYGENLCWDVLMISNCLCP